MLSPFDQVNNQLELASMDPADFGRAYGKQAAVFLQDLPALFRLLRRFPHDPDAPLEARHLAAAASLYIAEDQDYLSDHAADQAGLIDDVWLAYDTLARIVDLSGEETVSRHWRAENDFDSVLALARNASSLAEHVPTKVFEQLKRYIGD